MSHPVVSVASEERITAAAELMKRNCIGALPILDQGQPVGIVTDRDIVIRFVAGRDHAVSRPVSDIMSRDPLSCLADQSVAEAAAIMGDEQVRRLLVLDDQGQLVGLITVGDIARDVSEEIAGQALGEIVEVRNSVGR